jgi:hypothetical protein
MSNCLGRLDLLLTQILRQPIGIPRDKVINQWRGATPSVSKIIADHNAWQESSNPMLAFREPLYQPSFVAFALSRYQFTP